MQATSKWFDQTAHSADMRFCLSHIPPLEISKKHGVDWVKLNDHYDQMCLFLEIKSVY